MEIELHNLQRIPVPEALIIEAARLALTLRPVNLDQLSIVLTDDARITELNATFLGRPAPTDVIAFEAEEGAGEVFVSVDRATTQAAELGHDLAVELCFLTAHGVLHVCGMDDTQPDQRQQMLELQEQVLERISLR